MHGDVELLSQAVLRGVLRAAQTEVRVRSELTHRTLGAEIVEGPRAVGHEAANRCSKLRSAQTILGTKTCEPSIGERKEAAKERQTDGWQIAGD